MPKAVTTLAAELLRRDPGGLEELRLHAFADDNEAHDDGQIEKLYLDFAEEFDRVEAALTEQYGRPSRTGDEHHDIIPLSGIFRFAIWLVGDRQLFAAAAHEDRELPILLMLGTVDASFA